MNTKVKAIYFDMDGTIADLYNVENWLDHILTENALPFKQAKTMVCMNTLAKRLNNLQRKGYVIGVVTWTPRDARQSYNNAVKQAKLQWLKRHLKSVQWNEVHVVEYGTPKQQVVRFPQGILFDDEQQNRSNWQGVAYDVHEILKVLREL